MPEITEFWHACIYHEDLAYGGPEEGGWYYHCGTPDIRTCKIFDNPDEAREYCLTVLREIAKERNKDLPDISSVNSQGQYRAYVDKGMPLPYPEMKPTYE